MKTILISSIFTFVLSIYPNPINLDEVGLEEILKEKITVQELIQKLGEPEKYDPKIEISNLHYKTDKGAMITFRTTGKFITSALYARMNVKGIKPEYLSITTKVVKKENKQQLVFIVNKQEFDHLEKLKKHLLTLSKDLVIGYSNSCCVVPDEPIFTAKQQKDLKTFCRENEISILIHPSG